MAAFSFDAEGGVEQVVVLDITTGAEIARVDTASPLQSVLFPAPGENRDLCLCTVASVTRVSVTGPAPI